MVTENSCQICGCKCETNTDAMCAVCTSQLSVVVLTKEELSTIVESVKFHADIYSKDVTKTKWCLNRYKLANRLNKILKRKNK